jgi:Ca2+-binding EF-hand superfamily protein
METSDMKKTALMITGALVLALGTAGVASAMGPKDGRGPNFEQMFQELDANADGKLTKEEIEAGAAKRFADADTNGDGLLSKEELTAASEKRAESRRGNRIDRMFEHKDANNDGLLSQEEMASGKKRGMNADRMIERLDTDGDGAITLAEAEAAKGKWRGKRHGHDDN